jgi:hypothetical protein
LIPKEISNAHYQDEESTLMALNLIKNGILFKNDLPLNPTTAAI